MGADGGLLARSPAVAGKPEEKVEGDVGGEARVFRCADYSLPGTSLALALWLGGIHFNVLLVLASLFLFSRRTAAMSVPYHPITSTSPSV
jgi:diacylglycerol O-acyltransferase 2, plant